MNEEANQYLQQLVSLNENILEALLDIKSDLTEIREELNWTKEHSHSKMHLDKLEEIDSKLFDISLSMPE
ncbi:hypothetical protein GCM10009098_02940 [Rheinheimera aquimaris]|uniref:Uncharacterized protein n=1 Tax=Rheinheimera aquimaris TaxID=412437 RepID=A0ABP3N9C4_9GAMM|nr:hypothetical protein [Rheinheimera aquimaris]MCB5212528.1 hypothetical protein [Rheinheimera aquimaris]